MGLDDSKNSLRLGESASEDQEDVLTAAGKDLAALLMLKKCYEEMVAIARPFSDQQGKIKAPANRLPFERISSPVQTAVNKLDGAFIESMAMMEFIKVFEDGLTGVKEKIARLQTAGEGMGRDLR